jgi:hypothetical protein
LDAITKQNRTPISDVSAKFATAMVLRASWVNCGAKRPPSADQTTGHAADVEREQRAFDLSAAAGSKWPASYTCFAKGF